MIFSTPHVLQADVQMLEIDMKSFFELSGIFCYWYSSSICCVLKGATAWRFLFILHPQRSVLYFGYIIQYILSISAQIIFINIYDVLCLLMVEKLSAAVASKAKWQRSFINILLSLQELRELNKQVVLNECVLFQ